MGTCNEGPLPAPNKHSNAYIFMLLDSQEEITSIERGRFFTSLIIFGATEQSLQIKVAGTRSCFFKWGDQF